MSAHKTAIVRLGEAEYQRLRAAEEELRLQELRMGERNRDESASIYNQILEDNRARDQHFSALVQEVDQAAAEAVCQAAAWYTQQNLATEARIQDVEQNAAEWVEQVTQQMTIRQENLERILLQEAQNRQMQEEAARSQVEADDSDEAYALISGAQKMLEYLYQEYTTLDPRSANEIEVLREELNEAVHHFEKGRFDWAWQIGRAASSSLSRLRFQLEDDRRTREHLHHQLIVQGRDIYQRIADQQGVQAMDAEGNELPERIDTAFWTDGAYAHLVEHARQACLRLEKLEITDLNELAEWREELAILAERGLELVTQARLAVLASQLRFNVAQIVVKALETQGFFLEQAAYQQNDYRGAFTAQTRNLAGNEVVVTIDPDPGLDEGGRLSIESNDSNKLTEHEMRWRTNEIYDAIQSYGVNVKTTDTKPGLHKPELQPNHVAEKRQRYHSGRDDPDISPA